MTFIKQPEKEGESKECPNCGDNIVARLKVYKDYPDKIQWQDAKETKAHYDKDGNCKTKTQDTEIDPTLDIQETTVETSSNIEEANIEPISEENKLDESKTISEKAQLLWMIRLQVESTIKDLEKSPNGGMIWEMTKIIYQEVYGDKE